MERIRGGMQMNKGVHYDLAALVGTEMTAEEVRSLLVDVLEVLESLAEGDFKTKNIDDALRIVADSRELGLGQVLGPLRVSMQGEAGSHGLYETMVMAGKDRVVWLIKSAVRALGDRA
jgi:glutamyl-tRNA synthetase